MLTRVIQAIRRRRRKAVKTFRSARRRSQNRQTQLASFERGGRGDDVVAALEARGIPYAYVSGDEVPFDRARPQEFLAFKLNGAAYYFSVWGALLAADSRGRVAPISDGPFTLVLREKDVLKSVLQHRGFSVPDGFAVDRDAEAEACARATSLLAITREGVCVKPTSGKRGTSVYVGIKDLPSFRAAFRGVAKRFERVLIEETVTGHVYRFFCLAGRVIAIRYGIPVNVEGDGVRSVGELIDLKNAQRIGQSTEGPIKLKRPGRKHLAAQGMTLASIPGVGQVVWLGGTSNLEQGADLIDATDAVHASYVSLVERAVQSFPGLTLCGADVAIDDASVPATDANHHFLELNDCPGFLAHHHPTRGRSRDVAGAIIDFLLEAEREPGATTDEDGSAGAHPQ